MTKKRDSANQEEAIDREAKSQVEALASLSSQDKTEVGENKESEDSLVHVPLETIPVNVTLPCTVYMKKAGKTLVFRRQGERINYKTALEMQKTNSDHLYIHKAFWQMFNKSLETLSLNKGKENSEIKAVHMRSLLLAYGQELEKRVREPKKPMFEKLKALAHGIAEDIQRNPKVVGTLLRPSKDPLAYFVNHAVNCAVYATMIGIQVKLKEDLLKELAYAAIVHDVGNLYLPKRILYKRSQLTSDEMDLVKTHPRRGAELLLSLGASSEVVKAALQHHERMDGKGYPNGIKGEDIHLYARIIAIVDTFDALTSERPAQKGISAKEALEKMVTMEGAFDKNLLVMVKHPEANKPEESKAA